MTHRSPTLRWSLLVLLLLLVGWAALTTGPSSPDAPPATADIRTEGPEEGHLAGLEGRTSARATPVRDTNDATKSDSETLLESEQRPCTIRAVVTTTDAQPVPGATVIVRRQDDYAVLARSQTGAGGEAIIEDLTANRSVLDGHGRVYVEVRDARWVSRHAGEYSPSYLLAEGQTLKIPIVVSAAASIRGHVEDGDGPLEGATVAVGEYWFFHAASPDLNAVQLWHGKHAMSAQTGERGEFEFVGLRPGKRYVVVACTPRHLPGASKAVVVDADSPVTVKLMLKPGNQTTVRVTDDRGVPIAGATVTLICSHKGAPAKWFVGANRLGFGKLTDIRGTFLTNAQGVARLHALPVDAAVYYRVAKDGYAPLPTPGKPPPPLPRDGRDVSVTMQDGEFIAGIVVDEAGRPRAGVDLWATYDHVERSSGGFSAQSWTYQRARTDADGRFELSGLMEGRTSRLQLSYVVPIRVGGAGATRSVVHARMSSVPTGRRDVKIRFATNGTATLLHPPRPGGR